MQFSGAVAIVTGASSGIGEATARLLAKRGVQVVLVARSKKKLSALSDELSGAYAIPADLTKPGAAAGVVKRTVRRFGHIDILVNNAGRGYDAPVEHINLKKFRYIFELNLVAPLIMMQEVIPAMRKAGGGSIVNVSSGTALMILPNMGAYSSLKKAIGAISLTAREELMKDHISVCVVYPYVTATKFETNTLKDRVPHWDGEGLPHPPDTAEYVADRILSGIETGSDVIYAHDWMKPDSQG